eukprot:scaffold294201_cov31-Tisochrysis_lutea.AAC.1
MPKIARANAFPMYPSASLCIIRIGAPPMSDGVVPSDWAPPSAGGGSWHRYKLILMELGSAAADTSRRPSGSLPKRSTRSFKPVATCSRTAGSPSRTRSPSLCILSRGITRNHAASAASGSMVARRASFETCAVCRVTASISLVRACCSCIMCPYRTSRPIERSKADSLARSSRSRSSKSLRCSGSAASSIAGLPSDSTRPRIFLAAEKTDSLANEVERGPASRAPSWTPPPASTPRAIPSPSPSEMNTRSPMWRVPIAAVGGKRGGNKVRKVYGGEA